MKGFIQRYTAYKYQKSNISMQLSQAVQNLLTATVEVCKQKSCNLISGELMNPRLFQFIKR